MGRKLMAIDAPVGYPRFPKPMPGNVFQSHLSRPAVFAAVCAGLRLRARRRGIERSRHVLILDIWHPDLTAAEIWAVTEVERTSWYRLRALRRKRPTG
jgi:hypothetical protein